MILEKNKILHVTSSLVVLSVVLAFIAVTFSITGCANQVYPGGGEVDRIPPEITSLYPPNETINFNDDYFELGFSEFIDKRSLKDAIFISPSPEGELELTWTWNAKGVKVKFPKRLKQNTTYSVTIGTDLVDYNAKNRMAAAYSFAFSTGATVDKGQIQGRVFADKPNGVMLFAYKKDDTSKINPSVKKPDYISQAGDSGYFKIKGLGPGSYRVFAIDDQYRDLLFQSDQDKFGVPHSDITLTDKDTVFNNLNFFLTKNDTIKPRLLSAVMLDKHHILVGVSKESDSSFISPANFYLMDSTENKKTGVVYAFKGGRKISDIVLCLNSELKYENNIYLYAEHLKDLYGNVLPVDCVKLTTSDRKDTSKVIFTKISPVSGETVDYINPRFNFCFNDAFDSTKAIRGIEFTDTLGRRIDYKLRFIDNASFVIQPKEELQPKQDYRIKLDLNNFVNLNGQSLDSVFTYKFKTINGQDFTGASGSLINVDTSKNPVLVLQGTDKNKYTYVVKPDSGKTFNFERIEAGKYIIWGYYDENRDGKYSYGELFPYIPSERFIYGKVVLDLRPRWSVTDIVFDFEDK